MHLLDEPTGYISAMGKSNLGHQMRYSAERLEAELADDGEPRVLQLVCEGDEREPRAWMLYADGLKCAHGTVRPCGASARRPARSWTSAVKPCAPPLSRSAHDYELLCIARRIAAVEALFEGHERRRICKLVQSLWAPRPEGAHIKKLKHLLFVNRKAQVIDIKQRLVTFETQKR